MATIMVQYILIVIVITHVLIDVLESMTIKYLQRGNSYRSSHFGEGWVFVKINIQSFVHAQRENISSIYSSNSKAYASELLEDHEKMCGS